MKKLILMLFIFSAVFGFSCRVGFCQYHPTPEDITVNDFPKPTYDGLGRVISGTVCMRVNNSQTVIPFWSFFQNASYLYIEKTTHSGYNSYYLYGVKNNDAGTQYVTFKYFDISDSEINSSGDYKTTILQKIADASITHSSSTRPNQITWSDIYDQNNGGGFVVSNIPIFNNGDTDSINAYINNGSVDGAINKNDVVPSPELQKGIPKPTKITISDQTMQQKQNLFVNDVEFKVYSGNTTGLTGTVQGRYYVDLNILLYRTIAGVSDQQVLKAGNSHTGRNVVTGTKTYNSDGTYTVTISATELNNYISTIYSDNDISSAGTGTDSIFSHCYLNQLTISANNIYASGSEYIVGSWSDTFNFIYNYVTKSASGFDSEVPQDTEDATEVPDVTPNDDTGNGYDNNTGAQTPSGNINGKFDGNITNDYPKWDLWGKLTALFDQDNDIKTSVDSGFNNITDNLSFTSLLATVMPFMGSDYWDLIRLAMTMGIGVTGVRCVYKFLRG